MGDLVRTLKEIAKYPPHPPRTASRRYRETHHRLIVEQDRPCIICGVRHSTLDDPAHNRWGARQMETHHHIVEWALAGAIDLDRFNARIVPRLLARHGDRVTYGHAFTQAEMEAWIDGDEANLWVLCSTHHRSPLVGIHAVTHPIWGVQDLLRGSYDLTGFRAKETAHATS